MTKAQFEALATFGISKAEARALLESNECMICDATPAPLLLAVCRDPASDWMLYRACESCQIAGPGAPVDAPSH